MTRLAAAALAVVLFARATPALADNADRCADRAEEAQRARQENKLRTARDALIECARESCPAVVRRDCARWLSEVETELPTIVVRVRDGRGDDIVDVRISVDDARVADKADGRPIALDAGEHVVRVQRGGAVVSRRIVVGNGERARVLAIDLAPDLPASKPAPAERGSRVPAIVLGAVGLGLVAGGSVLWALGRGEHDDLESSCAPTGACATSDIDAARTKLIVGDVFAGVGLLAVAGAITWLYLR
ncbi:MAG: hypothetical protein U0270_29835 [Labilithrix sp.]